MADQKQQNVNQPADGLVSCDVCLKEIPKSESKVEEASDYVAYFCGLECYEKWQQEKDSKD